MLSSMVPPVIEDEIQREAIKPIAEVDTIQEDKIPSSSSSMFESSSSILSEDYDSIADWEAVRFCSLKKRALISPHSHERFHAYSLVTGVRSVGWEDHSTPG